MKIAFLTSNPESSLLRPSAKCWATGGQNMQETFASGVARQGGERK